MSTRIHVVAARGDSAGEFQDALHGARSAGPGESTCSPFHFGSSGDWQWATASVWHIGAAEIDQAIATLPGVTLRTTTSDGILWMITVVGSGRDVFHGVHFFAAGGWDADDPDERNEDPDFPEHQPDEVAGIDRDDPDVQFLWETLGTHHDRSEYGKHGGFGENIAVASADAGSTDRTTMTLSIERDSEVLKPRQRRCDIGNVVADHPMSHIGGINQAAQQINL